MNRLTSALLGQYVKFVRGSVGTYGGHVTWEFSQVVNPVASLIGTDTETADGICEMLSAKWIDEHAHERSLAAWLMDGNSVNPSKIRMLMQLFIVGGTMRPSKMLGRDDVRGMQRGDQDQDKATQNFLLSRGIIRRGGGLQNGWGVGARAGGEKIKRKLAQDLCDVRGGTGSYRIVGIWGRSGGHCMAAYTGLKDIAFFDPNFGEFCFEDKAKFKTWFAESFFVRSTYSKLMDDRYELHDYGLKV